MTILALRSWVRVPLGARRVSGSEMSSDSGLLTYDGYDVYYIDISEYVSTGTLLQSLSRQTGLLAPLLH